MSLAAPTPRPDWKPVALYFLLACAISGPFFYWAAVLDWKGFHGPGFVKTMAYMWGPGLAGLLCHLLYRKRYQKQITVTGRSVWKSVAVWVLPLLLLAALGLKTADGRTDHTTPLLLMGFGFLTVWGEETGWRWFLQDYLQGMTPWKKYLIIGVLWELWHFRFFSQPLPRYILSELTFGIPLTLVLATLIGMATDRTKSLAVAATLHGWIDLPLEFGQWSAWVSAVVAVALCVWFCATTPREPVAPAAAGSPPGSVARERS